MFTLNNEDLQCIFDSAGKSVIVNDTKMNVIITNPAISECEERYIHSLQKVSRGDMVTLEDEPYLCITESVTKRSSKFKTLIRHCNFNIEIPGEQVCTIIGYNSFDEPIEECTYGEPTLVPSIIDNKTLSVDGQSAIRLAENQIEVIVQDNEVNSEKFTVNFTFNVMGKSWRVVDVDLCKSGLMILTCEKV